METVTAAPAEENLPDEIAGPAELGDGDGGGIANGPPTGSPGKERCLSAGHLMRRLNEAAATVESFILLNNPAHRAPPL